MKDVGYEGKTVIETFQGMGWEGGSRGRGGGGGREGMHVLYCSGDGVAADILAYFFIVIFKHASFFKKTRCCIFFCCCAALLLLYSLYSVHYGYHSIEWNTSTTTYLVSYQVCLKNKDVKAPPPESSVVASF